MREKGKVVRDQVFLVGGKASQRDPTLGRTTGLRQWTTGSPAPAVQHNEQPFDQEPSFDASNSTNDDS